jgi:hypothetical protein
LIAADVSNAILEMQALTMQFRFADDDIDGEADSAMHVPMIRDVQYRDCDRRSWEKVSLAYVNTFVLSVSLLSSRGWQAFLNAHE